jgi:chaperone required for assembly of F1-ATPase
MKRFYQRAEAAAAEGGYQVLLDGRPIRTPARRLLLLPTAGLAEAIAAEWAAQGEAIEPAAMPLMRLTGTACDRMPALRAPAIADIVAYAGTDLVCYRAAGPADLAERQATAWQPHLDWLAARFDIHLLPTAALRPTAQPAEASERLRALIAAQADWPLVGLHAATTALGSVVLALALWHRRLDAEAAFAASIVDELYEIERWGREREAERRQGALRRDIQAAARYLAEFPPG